MSIFKHQNLIYHRAVFIKNLYRPLFSSQTCSFQLFHHPVLPTLSCPHSNRTSSHRTILFRLRFQFQSQYRSLLDRSFDFGFLHRASDFFLRTSISTSAYLLLLVDVVFYVSTRLHTAVAPSTRSLWLCKHHFLIYFCVFFFVFIDFDC